MTVVVLDNQHPRDHCMSAAGPCGHLASLEEGTR